MCHTKEMDRAQFRKDLISKCPRIGPQTTSWIAMGTEAETYFSINRKLQRKPGVMQPYLYKRIDVIHPPRPCLRPG